MTELNRYRVVEVWGEVPEQIRDMVEKDGAFLLYPEWRGVDSVQHFLRIVAIVGGWAMQYAGKRPA